MFEVLLEVVGGQPRHRAGVRLSVGLPQEPRRPADRGADGGGDDRGSQPLAHDVGNGDRQKVATPVVVIEVTADRERGQAGGGDLVALEILQRPRQQLPLDLRGPVDVVRALEFALGPLRQLDERLELLRVEVSRDEVVEAERAHRVAGGPVQRVPGVEADAPIPADAGDLREFRVRGGVLDDQRGRVGLTVRACDGGATHRLLAGDDGQVKAVDGLDPLAVAIHEGQRRGRHPEDPSGHPGDLIETPLRRGIEEPQPVEIAHPFGLEVVGDTPRVRGHRASHSLLSAAARAAAEPGVLPTLQSASLS